jgi:hypothetical protein
MAFESDLKPLLFNQLDWAEFDTKGNIKLNPLSKLVETQRVTGSSSIEITDYVGGDKSQNFYYSLSITKKGGTVLEVTEIYADKVNQDNRPIYQAQVMRIGELTRFKDYTVCEGALTKKKVEGELTRFFPDSEEKIFLDLRCHTVDELFCDEYQSAENYAKNTRNTKYLADKITEKYAGNMLYQNKQAANMLEITQSAIPGGRSNLVWPRNPLQHQYSVVSKDEPMQESELPLLTNKCNTLTAYFKPDTTDGTEVAYDYGRMQNAANYEIKAYRLLNERKELEYKYHNLPTSPSGAQGR